MAVTSKDASRCAQYVANRLAVAVGWVGRQFECSAVVSISVKTGTHCSSPWRANPVCRVKGTPDDHPVTVHAAARVASPMTPNAKVAVAPAAR
jgi:hypothetical protein